MSDSNRQLADDIRAWCTAVVIARGEGHLGSCLSVADILASLYGGELRVRASDPAWRERDRFVMSKAHSSLAYYAALGLSGFFPVGWLWGYAEFGSPLQLEPISGAIPGVDMATGPLGTGLSKAVGALFAIRRKGLHSRIVVLVGDGEIQKGQVWEAIAFAGRMKLQGLVVIVDVNGRQLDGLVGDVAPADLSGMYRAAGWTVTTVDGHDVSAISAALAAANSSRWPTCVLARTTKGKGIAQLETDTTHHYFKASDQALCLPDGLACKVNKIGRQRGQGVNVF